MLHTCHIEEAYRQEGHARVLFLCYMAYRDKKKSPEKVGAARKAS